MKKLKIFIIILIILLTCCENFLNSVEEPSEESIEDTEDESSEALEELVLYGYWSDNMVIQRNQDLIFEGTDTPGQLVIISFNNQESETVADSSGEWMISLNAMPANTEGQCLEITGSKEFTYENVLIGDVWLASGQSNMEYFLLNSSNWDLVETDEEYPQVLRILKIRKDSNRTELLTFTDQCWTWTDCSVNNLKYFSAVAYYFAKSIKDEINVPIGIISSSYSGTIIQAWCNKENLISVGGYSEEDFVYNSANSPCALYNAMIKPLTYYNITGFLWYQGESDVSSETIKEKYSTMLQTLQCTCEESFNHKNLPFCIVQIPNWSGYGLENYGDLVTDQMDYVESNSYSSIISVADTIDDLDNIHPPAKLLVGQRLARVVLNKHYVEEYPEIADDVFNGPRYVSAETESGVVTITYSNVGSGLSTWDSQELTGLQIAGEDGVFYDAISEIVDNTVVVSSEEVFTPLYIRTGYSDLNNIYNLSNIDGYCSPAFSAYIGE